MDTPFRFELQIDATILNRIVEAGLGFVDTQIGPSFTWKGKTAIAQLALAFGDALVWWGDDGLTVEDSGGRRRILESPVRDAEVFRGELHVLEAGRLSVWDRALTAVTKRYDQGGEALARAGKSLLVRDGSVIRELPAEPGRTFTPIKSGDLRTMGIDSRRRAKVRLGRGEPDHAGLPWPVTAPRIGRAVVRITDEGALEIWKFVGAHEACTGDAPTSAAPAARGSERG